VIGNRSAKNVPNLIGLSDARFKTGYDVTSLPETINYCWSPREKTVRASQRPGGATVLAS